MILSKIERRFIVEPLSMRVNISVASKTDNPMQMSRGASWELLHNIRSVKDLIDPGIDRPLSIHLRVTYNRYPFVTEDSVDSLDFYYFPLLIYLTNKLNIENVTTNGS
jgi:hypothetical protein